jgi:hypothetical protein
MEPKMKLTLNDILSLHGKLKKKAINACNNGNYDVAIKCAIMTAHIAYIFSWCFYDKELEILLKDLSTKILPAIPGNYRTFERYVFYDCYSLDNKGLTQQYIQAIMALNMEFIYITESSTADRRSRIIFNELSAYPKAKILEVPRNIKERNKIKYIYDAILTYHPTKLFMHLSPSAACAIVAFYALPKNIIKYQINITDHAFWLGNSCLDYSLEFRPYGCNVSLRNRAIKAEQILLMPYYPIVSDQAFEGFPPQSTDKVIIFSGGAFYKVFGGDGIYFKLVKRILDENSGVVFLFGGSGNTSIFDSFIKNNGYEERFLMLGYRFDINEIFKHCDIYMNTFPESGGLMCQYAAMNGKPILSFVKDGSYGCEAEQTICQLKQEAISFSDEEEFYKEAKKLIQSKDYRIEKGEKLRGCVINKDLFNKNFYDAILFHKNPVPYKEEPIRTSLIDSMIEIEEKDNGFKLNLIKRLGLRSVTTCPKVLLWFIEYLFTSRGVSFIINKLRMHIMRFTNSSRFSTCKIVNRTNPSSE